MTLLLLRKAPLIVMFVDPVHTVFNTTKIASQYTEIQGRVVPNQKLMNIDPQSYGDILGADIVPEITTNGTVDLEKLGTIINTLPNDMKSMLLKELGL